jgi:hypothetical protein
METVCFSETWVSTYKSTRRQNLEYLSPSSAMKIKTVCSCETFVSTDESTRHKNTEDQLHYPNDVMNSNSHEFFSI